MSPGRRIYVEMRLGMPEDYADVFAIKKGGSFVLDVREEVGERFKVGDTYQMTIFPADIDSVEIDAVEAIAGDPQSSIERMTSDLEEQIEQIEQVVGKQKQRPIAADIATHDKEPSEPGLPEPGLLNEDQAAEILGFSVRTLQKWRGNGSGPVFVRISSNAVRYRKVDLDAWVNERLRKSTKKKRRSVKENPARTSGTRIIRTDELAERLGISRVTLWRWEREGLIPGKRRIGPRTVGWLEREVEEWFATIASDARQGMENGPS